MTLQLTSFCYYFQLRFNQQGVWSYSRLGVLQIIERPSKLYADAFDHPPLRLVFWRPIWSDMTSVDTVTQWREDWSSGSVINHTTVTDPTIQQPGFDLCRRTWSLLNVSGQVKAQVMQTCTNGVLPSHHLVIMAASDHEPHCWHRHTNKIWRGLNLLHKADDDAVIWLESTTTAVLAKWNDGCSKSNPMGFTE